MNKKLVALQRLTNLTTSEVEIKITYNPHGLNQSTIEELLWCKENIDNCLSKGIFTKSALNQVTFVCRGFDLSLELVSIIASSENWECARKSYEHSKKEF